jgi:catechol 2,3-dioxygenase-like lactoylglutathione lyase family enzyme
MVIWQGARGVAFVHVRDAAAAHDFYANRLGLSLAANDEYGEFFALGDGLLRVTALPDFQPSPHPVAGLHVPDVAAMVRQLAGHGVAMIRYPGMGQDEAGIWASPDGRWRIAWFADPDGNVLSLSEGR